MVHGTFYLRAWFHQNNELPMICRLSPCQLEALNAQSFVERMNLCAKLIVGEKRTRLNHELIDKLVTLCMNLKFMIYCRGEHALIGKVNEVQNDMGNDKDIYIDEYKY